MLKKGSIQSLNLMQACLAPCIAHVIHMQACVPSFAPHANLMKALCDTLRDTLKACFIPILKN